MSMFKRHPRMAVAVVAMAVTAGIAVPASPAGAAVFTNACKNNLTANNSQIDVDMTAASPAAVPPGASFGLTNIKQTVKVPPAVFLAGYNLGLLQVGQNNIQGTARTIIEATNTVQGTQATNSAPGSISTTITDPDGTPGTLDESATPGDLPVTYADQTWTASGPNGSTIQFREDTVPVTDLTTPDKGGIVINATLSIFKPQFRCSPGTVAGAEPGVVTLIDPGPAFATSGISASAPPPPPPPGPVPGPGGGTVSNNFRFGSVTLNRKRGTAKLGVRVPGKGRVVLARTAQVRLSAKRATKAGIVTLTVRARGRALLKLNRTGKVTVSARISYTPTGGKKRTKTKRVTLRKVVRRLAPRGIGLG